jgi:diacylglycerol kinase (ATP)
MQLNRKIVYLVNPISGTKKKDALVAYIHSINQEKKIPYEVLATTADGNYNWLQEKIDRETITDVIVVGGDGTVNQVVHSVGTCKVNIGIIPSGSGNGLAFAAKIPKDYKKAIAIILQGKAITTDAFQVNHQFACMLTGLGFDAQVAHDFAEQATRGLITYTKQSLKNFIRAKPYPFEISIGSKTYTTDAFFISIANSNQFGNHFTIAPKASLHDGLLDIVIVQKMSKFKLPFAILAQLRKRKTTNFLADNAKENTILYVQTPTISIKNLGNAPLHIDGDPASTNTDFEFKILPNYFKLLVP